MHLSLLAIIALLASDAACRNAPRCLGQLHRNVACLSNAANQPDQTAPPMAAPTGNASESQTWPYCAQICANETVPASGCNVKDINCACSADYRSKMPACVQSSCSAKSDIRLSSMLSQQLCGPSYMANGSLASAVQSAVAAATTAAAYFTQGEVPTEPLNYPPCAQNCNNAHDYGGCNSLSNTTCLCKGPAFSESVGSCYTAFCNTDDLQTVTDLKDKLCFSVGGISNTSNSSVLAFTGEAPRTSFDARVWVGTVVTGGIIGALLAL